MGSGVVIEVYSAAFGIYTTIFLVSYQNLH